MASEQAIRDLLVEHLGVAENLIDRVQVIDIALGLGDMLGVCIPVYRLRNLRNYHDVLRAARDALCDQLARSEGEFYVRAKLRAGNVTVVRVGVLTTGFAAALAEDLRHAPPGSWLEVTVPHDLDDTAVTGLRRRLMWLVGPGSLVVKRAGEMGPNSSSPWDQMSQPATSNCHPGSLAHHIGGGTAIAHKEDSQPHERGRFPT